MLALGIWLAAFTASAQIESPLANTIRSVSGQFIVRPSPTSFSPLFNRPELATNENFVRLEPALLAVSAEHFKNALWRQLGLKPDAGWRGKIFLNLHPALSPDDDVVIAITPVLNEWDYRLELPDVVRRARYARSLAAALLLEIANRAAPAGGHSAEIPDWLADGLAQTVLNEDVSETIFSAPDKTVPGFSFSGDRLVQFKVLEDYSHEKKRGLDSLAAARAVLQSHPALAFDELSWPSPNQIRGGDGGVYLASAQLFVHELLALKNGPQKMRALLAKLPQFYNWQTAFFAAFHDNFQSPLDVEKWWALRVVDFGARGSGSQWTVAESRRQLAALLAVPVNTRQNADSLPRPSDISLQAAIRTLSPAQRDATLAAKLDDFAAVQLRFAPEFAALVAGYRAALENFLGNRRKISPPATAVASAANRPPSANFDGSKNIQAYLEELKQNPRLAAQSASPATTPAARPTTAADLEKKATPVYSLSANDFAATRNNSLGVSADKHEIIPMLKRASVKKTLKKLDALDVQRRELEARLDANASPRSVAVAAP